VFEPNAEVRVTCEEVAAGPDRGPEDGRTIQFGPEMRNPISRLRNTKLAPEAKKQFH